MKKLFNIFILTFLLSVGFTNLQAQFIFDRALGTSGYDSPKELLITNDGNYLVMGYSGSGSPTDSSGLYLAKLDTAGNKLWEKWHYMIGGMGTGFINTICEASDNSFVIGNKYYNGNGYDGFLIKLDANGDTLFNKRDSIILGEEVTKVLQAPDGNLLALINDNGASSLVKLDNNFNQIARIDSILPQTKGIEVINNKIYYLKKDSIDNLLIIDNDLQQIDTVTIPMSFPVYLKKSFDTTQLIVEGNNYSNRRMVYVDLFGNVNTICDSVFDGYKDDFKSLNSNNDFIYMGYDYDTQWGADIQLFFTNNCGEILHDTVLYRRSYTIQPLDEFGKRVLVDADGNYLLFGEAKYGVLGETDIFLVKYKQWDGFSTGIEDSNIELTQLENNIIAYPNPFQEQFTVTGIKTNSSIVVMDVMGKVIYQNSTLNTQYSIPTPNWAKGLYIIQVKSFEHTTTLKVVKQ
jgi:hypothetical protein